jgi:hypothetical protein
MSFAQNYRIIHRVIPCLSQNVAPSPHLKALSDKLMIQKTCQSVHDLLLSQIYSKLNDSCVVSIKQNINFDI